MSSADAAREALIQELSGFEGGLGAYKSSKTKIADTLAALQRIRPAVEALPPPSTRIEGYAQTVSAYYTVLLGSLRALFKDTKKASTQVKQHPTRWRTHARMDAHLVKLCEGLTALLDKRAELVAVSVPAAVTGGEPVAPPLAPEDAAAREEEAEAFRARARQLDAERQALQAGALLQQVRLLRPLMERLQLLSTELHDANVASVYLTRLHNVKVSVSRARKWLRRYEAKKEKAAADVLKFQARIDREESKRTATDDPVAAEQHRMGVEKNTAAKAAAEGAIVEAEAKIALYGGKLAKWVSEGDGGALVLEQRSLSGRLSRFEKVLLGIVRGGEGGESKEEVTGDVTSAHLFEALLSVLGVGRNEGSEPAQLSDLARVRTIVTRKQTAASLAVDTLQPQLLQGIGNLLRRADKSGGSDDGGDNAATKVLHRIQYAVSQGGQEAVQDTEEAWGLLRSALANSAQAERGRDRYEI